MSSDTNAARQNHSVLVTGFGLTHCAAALMKIGGFWRALLALCLGALAALSMAPFSFFLALLLSLTGFVWLLDGAASEGRIPFRRGAMMGWCYGFGYFLAGFYWVGFAFLVDADFFAWMIPFVIVLLPAGLALFIATGVMIAGRFWCAGVTRLAALTVALALAEWLRGHILTGFPWNIFGYAWSGSLEISQSASVFGVYGLTVLAIWVGVSPAAFSVPAFQGRQPWRWPALALCLVAVMWLYGAWRVSAHPTTFVENATVRLVQPSIPQAEKWAPGNGQRILQTYLDLTSSDGFDNVTHVIWPESAVPYRLSSRSDVVRAITSVLGVDRVLLTGSVRADYDNVDPQELRFYNSLHVIQQTDLAAPNAIRATYDKFHLVPFGEYLPAAWLLESLGLKKIVYGEASGYSEGPGPRTLNVPGLPDMSPMICYEIIFPGRTLADKNAEWILTVTNDGWFGDSSGPRQHFSMARFRAIETGRPVVRSANNGISGVIDPVGRVLSSMDINAIGVLDSPLPERIADTLFLRFGTSVFWLCLLAILGIGWAGSRRHAV